jgi:hypothetical protein
VLDAGLDRIGVERGEQLGVAVELAQKSCGGVAVMVDQPGNVPLAAPEEGVSRHRCGHGEEPV